MAKAYGKAYNIVHDWNTNETLYTTFDGLDDACDWMMARIDEFDIHNVSADEVLADGDLGGSWFIVDLLENNPNGWTLPDGTVVIGRIDDKTWDWVITKEPKTRDA